MINPDSLGLPQKPTAMLNKLSSKRLYVLGPRLRAIASNRHAIAERSSESVDSGGALPSDIIENHRGKLKDAGWSEQEIEGKSKNPAEYSILQVLHRGSSIIKITDEIVRIRHATNNIVTYRKGIGVKR